MGSPQHTQEKDPLYIKDPIPNQAKEIYHLVYFKYVLIIAPKG